MTTKSRTFTEREQQVWDAAYGAAFAAEASVVGVDGADSAELAGTIANKAVFELRRWQKQEAPRFGEELSVVELGVWEGRSE